MSRAIIPIRELKQRPVELGRIRIGVKTGKAMKSIDTFRLTSSDRTALDQVAAHYGGEVRPWSDDKAAEGQFEVITTAPEIRIALPEDPLGGTPMYELYGGGGRERWCDGERCEIWNKGHDGPEPSEVPCFCSANGELECKPTVHLSVMLPDVRGIGTWRLTTHSWNAAQEMPAMVKIIHGLQAEGIQRGVLRIERKRSVQAGQTRKFPVPTLGVDRSIEEMIAGENTVGRLAAAAPVAEIGAGEVGADPAPALPPPDPDDEPIEAEIVDEPTSGWAEAQKVKGLWDQHNPKARALAAKAFGAAAEERWGELIEQMTDGRTRSSKELDEGEWADMLAVLQTEADKIPSEGGGSSSPAALAGCDTGPAKAGALRRARRLAEERGLEPPAAFDEIPEDLAAEVAKELAA